MSVTWFEDAALLPFVRQNLLAVGHPRWGFAWREVGRNTTHSFVVADWDAARSLMSGLPSESVDPATISDEGAGRKTARCLGGSFPEVPARVRARRKAYLRWRPELARSVARQRAKSGLPGQCW